MSTRTFRGARLVRFGPFELDLRAAELRKHGVRLRLQEQPFRILVMLLERPGEAVLRDELRKRLWPNDTVVEVGHGINAAILRLREALGESAGNPRYIETLARRGYRFTGEVEVVLKEEAPPVVPSPSGLDTDELEGKTVSHYTVQEKLGGGGMGVVYRAHDLTLDRDVALKFLPRELAGNTAAQGRFQREARAASALNHPNVCTIYGVEDCGGQPAIVMEMIEGETLAARLERGPLPEADAIRLAIQVAGALDAAHRKSIVHRDLKPGNLIVTAAGVKVLDFGLAKMGRGTLSRDRPGVTAASNLTQHGAVMGTLHYMSPEQVQGRETDARSDIFSFGLVLYEMLTGRRALEGDSTGEAVKVPGSLAPQTVGWVLRRCLEKDPEERWQSARDLKVALEWIAVHSTPAVPRVSPDTRKVQPVWAVGTAAVVVLAGLVLAVTWRLESGEPWARLQSQRNPPPPPAAPVSAASMKLDPITKPLGLAVRAAVLAFQGMTANRFSLSPDGRTLAFLSGGDLCIRSMASDAVRVVSRGAGTGTPFWSPDGKSLAFARGRQLKRISIDGGEPATICDVNTNIAGAWGPDGTILIGMVGDGIYRVPAGGGIPERVTSLVAEYAETRHMLPQFLPGGRQFLYVAGAANTEKSRLFAVTLGASGRAAVMPVGSSVTYVPGRDGQRGYLLFVRDRMLMAQRFDVGRLHLTGEPQVLAGGVSVAAAIGTAVEVAEFSAVRDTLVYRSGSALSVIHNWQDELK